jgi:galactonate dehydratase
VRISGFRTHVLGTPWRNLTFLVLETDDGIEGVAEVRMPRHTDALLGYLADALPRHVVGTDPFAVESLVLRMRRDDYSRPGEIVLSGISLAEIACWDIMGKALGEPVYRLLGGAVRDSIPAYANGWYTVERTPEDFHQAATRVVERGYRALKLDPFGSASGELGRRELADAVALVEAVRDAIGPDAELLIEMHGRFTPSAAIAAARALERFEPGWIEEPVAPENVQGHAHVRRSTAIPVATGERIHGRSEFRPFLELEAADVLQADITHSGGLLETRKIASWAESYQVLVAPHNVGGPVSTAAALHLAAVTPNFKLQEHFNDFVDAEVKAAAPGNPEVVDGAFALPTGPGLGVTLDEEFVAAHPRVGAEFNLFSDDWQLRGAR